MLATSKFPRPGWSTPRHDDKKFGKVDQKTDFGRLIGGGRGKIAAFWTIFRLDAERRQHLGAVAPDRDCAVGPALYFDLCLLAIFRSSRFNLDDRGSDYFPGI
jgi:hypothetical protein